MIKNLIKCFFKHNWIYRGRKGAGTKPRRECLRCGRKETGSYDPYYGATGWKKD